MKLEFLAQVLQDGGCGTVGVDIFVHHMDGETPIGILLRNPLDGTPVDANLPDYYRHKLQVVVRHTSQAEGDALAARVGKLMKMFNRTFNNLDGSLGMRVNHIFPSFQPIVYPRTPGQGIEWSLNFTTSYVEPS